MANPPPSQTRRDLRLITVDGLLFMIMVGCGEAYFIAFAVALGMGEILSGLVGSVPLLIGGALQLLTPVGVRRAGSLRRWVVICASIQSLSFLPLAAGAMAGAMPVILVFGIVSLYWTVNYSAGPAWNTWITTLVPSRIRAKYFARRTLIIQLGTVVGLVGAGAALHLAKGASDNASAVGVFAWLFGAACLCRVISTACLASQSEPEPMPPGFRPVSARQFLGRWRHGHDARLLGYMLLTQAAFHVAGPFFTPFMLVRLELDYASFMVLVAASFVARSAVLPLLGRIARISGTRTVLLIGGIGLVPTAALWVVHDNFWYLLALQLVIGAMFAAYELATFLMLFETIPASERTSVLSLFNFANTLAIVGGSLVGAAFLAVMGEGVASYHALFILSSVLRLLTLPLLLIVRTPKFKPVPLELQPNSVRPAVGALDRPVLASVEDDAEGVRK